MEKKDILDLNKKERRDDEGQGYEKRETSLAGRNCAFIMIFFVQLLNAIAEKSYMNRQLMWILLALACGEGFSYYKIREHKKHLVFPIIFVCILIFELGKYMIAIGP